MCLNEAVTSIFESFQKDLQVEQDKREAIRLIVKDLDHVTRHMMTTLQSVHKPGGLSKVDKLIAQANALLKKSVKGLHTKLMEAVPPAEFYRYHDQWKYVTQKMVFVVSFIEFLTSDRLLLWQEAAEHLFLTTDRSVSDKLYLDLEDYLHGIISLSNELSRLAVNSVTAADFKRPLQIASFMGDLDSGFRLLNLKNDSLRKRFDSIKYDMKKVEEVVYDVTIRGLSKASVETSDSSVISSGDSSFTSPAEDGSPTKLVQHGATTTEAPPQDTAIVTDGAQKDLSAVPVVMETSTASVENDAIEKEVTPQE